MQSKIFSIINLQSTAFRPSKQTLVLFFSVFSVSSLLGVFMLWYLLDNGGRHINPFIAKQGDSTACSLRKWKPNMAADNTWDFRPLTMETHNGTLCILASSAYVDVRLGTIEILTDADKACYNLSATDQPELLCLVWYHNRNDPHTSWLRFSYVATHNPYRSQRVGVVYSCDMDHNNEDKPYAVTILPAKLRCRSYSKVTTLPITYPKGKERTFVVCTPPIFGYVRTQEVVQFIEIHRLLGAERFYFYNASIPSTLSEVLDGYISEGIVEVIQWHSFYPSRVFYNNQGIMQIDCMYRNMFKAKYVAQVDIDEVLMPRGHFATWKELVNDRFTTATAVLVFRNRYYTTDNKVQCRLTNATHDEAGMLPSYMKRLKYYNVTFKPHERSKMLYSPQRVLRIWTHSATPCQDYKSVYLDMNEGVLHHYRFSSRGTNDSLLDMHMCTVTEALYDRVLQRLRIVRSGR